MTTESGSRKHTIIPEAEKLSLQDRLLVARANKDYGTALDYCNKALGQDPDNIGLSLQKHIILRELTKDSEAYAALNSQFIQSILNNEVKGQTPSAYLAKLDKAIKVLDKENILQYALSRAESAMREGHPMKALAVLARAIKLHNDKDLIQEKLLVAVRIKEQMLLQ